MRDRVGAADRDARVVALAGGDEVVREERAGAHRGVQAAAPAPPIVGHRGGADDVERCGVFCPVSTTTVSPTCLCRSVRVVAPSTTWFGGVDTVAAE